MLKECLKADPPPHHLKLGPFKLDSSFATDLLDTADREVRMQFIAGSVQLRQRGGSLHFQRTTWWQSDQTGMSY